MQEWTDIRRKVLVERVSKRSVCSEYGIGWRTLEKILTNSEPPGYRTSAPRPKTKLGPYLGVISEILASDRDAPPKQHHTAKRIFERLRDEYGYSDRLTHRCQIIETRGESYRLRDAKARIRKPGASGGAGPAEGATAAPPGAMEGGPRTR